jgi:C terminal of Calcineurin-like phosphoesterase/N terminal of Calcineurin-like phosphoesterase/Calcineurin-like phosphoesterase
VNSARKPCGYGAGRARASAFARLRLAARFACGCALLLTACRGPIQPLAREPGQAVGVVYHDRDEDGARGASEPGLPGVAVSNGRELVRTDSEGRYRLPVDDDTILFVVKPSGWRTPVGPDRLPRFYYIHKPAGSAPGLRFPGVAPTGPLPDSVDFGLRPQAEPERFRVIAFGDTQVYDLEQLDYLSRDAIAELIGTDAAFGFTLGDLVGDDLSLFEPLNRAIARIGVPWYPVIGNHDMNYDAQGDEDSDESYERVYGPSTYAFEYARAHFLLIDDVVYGGANGERSSQNYRGGFSQDQLAFLRAYLAEVPRDHLVVALMHMPIAGPPPFGFEQGRELLALLSDRPNTLSFSSHTHMQYQLFLGPDAGFQGAAPHLHVNQAAVAGSWWLGAKDELGIPHATMRCGAPNGWSILEIDGARFRLRFQAARRPASHQMSIFAPASVASAEAGATEVLVDVFAGSGRSLVEMRLGDTDAWQTLEPVERPDPFYLELLAREAAAGGKLDRPLPPAADSLHLWRGTLPESPPAGTHAIEVRTTDFFGQTFSDRRLIRIE